MMSSSTAITTTTAGEGVGPSNNPSNNNNKDPYLQDDFLPLAIASTEIKCALRADESAPDADLYRRLISSSGVGAHGYHVVKGDNEGCGEVDNRGVSSGSPRNGGGAAAGGGQQPSTSSPRGNVIGSPLGVLRGSRQYGTARPSETSHNASTSNANNTAGTHQPTPSKSTPPTSFLKHEKSLPLPNHLAVEAQKANQSSLMGLLPEANLVWLTADAHLYLWSYKSDSTASDNLSGGADQTSSWGTSLPSHNLQSKEDYCSFTVPSQQCIVSVGLVRPKPGVFNKNVGWCIVVTTPEEVILCALARESLSDDYNSGDGSSNDGGGGGFRHGTDSILRLIPTRYTLPTDSVPITTIAGTKGGRIFLGGNDGNLYEFSYEGNVPGRTVVSGAMTRFGGSGSDVMEAAIDDYFDGRGVFNLDSTGLRKQNGLSVSGALSGGKRVISALTFGSLDDASSGGTPSRSRKCRKINHSSSAPGLISYVAPGALLRIASGIFGSSIEAAAKKGGPIVKIVSDEERLCLYTLGAKGVICSYDISPLPNASGSKSSGSLNSAMATAPPRLASVFDAISTAKLYLDSVSRGRMYPPSTSQSVALGTITFPGGIASAQSGVGGMEGARDILKKHDLEMRLLKASAAQGGGTSAGSRNVRNELSNNTAGILHPVSVHLVPATESKSLTLVAITGGGLRYYLSSLSSSYINSAQAMGGGFDYATRGQIRGSGNMDPRLAAMRPGRKMMFCHVRAPPPYTSNDGNDGFRFELAPSAVNLFSGGTGGGGGLPPGVHSDAARGTMAGRNIGSAGGDVVKSCYGNGVFVMALDLEKKPARNASSAGNNFFSNPQEVRSSSSSSMPGDAIVVALPDFAARVTQPTAAGIVPGSASYANMTVGTSSASTATTQVTPGGISEAIVLPMAGLGGTASPILPGGRTFDIVSDSNKKKSSVVSLFMNSETPTDAELQVGLMPSFTPRKKLQKKSTPKSTDSRALVVANDRGRGMISNTLSALSFYLRNRQGYGYQVGTVSDGSQGFGPAITYRISVRHGCDSVGFSNSAGESLSMSRSARRSTSSSGARGASTASAKSARLPSWLLRPSAAPLNIQASQHLTPPSAGGVSGSSGGSNVLILNSGGLHFFSNSSLLNNLATVLLRANNVAKDAMVKNFFVSYGYAEGCAMAFALATSTSSSDSLRGKAEQAALCYAHRPVMKLTGPSAGDGHYPITSYTFQPSSLYEGLVKFLSRLLRPFWYKPAVVVTEGMPIHSKSAYANYYASLPAKVELLLGDVTLEELRRPLVFLQNLMKKTFVPAVQSIPGASKKNVTNDDMDVDDPNSSGIGGSGSGGGLITRAMQNQERAVAAAQRMNNTNQTQYATAKELESTAERNEDRNMHSLYRLLSRCVQVLNLMSCLRRAQETPALPEVQWGLLHGLTFYQLVTSQEGQARIETLLNALVSQGEKTFVNGLSTDGDLLAETLSRECYLFFSSASRLTYLGFRSANDALPRPPTSPQRGLLADQAAKYLRAASRHWYAPTLVAGRFMSKNGEQSWEEVATNAMEAGSPLALAADILMKLGHVEGLADVCLICASNFGGARVQPDKRKELGENNVQGMLGWERGLYHRPPSDTAARGDARSAGTQAIVTGLDVTALDALKTCHSIIFHYISKLLGEAGALDGVSNQRLAEELVATCAASSDVKFLQSLYEHLLATNNVETALRIDSSSLENWLLKEKKDLTLTWKFYSFHGRHVLAGDIMWKKAQESDDKIPLDQRIECLTRASNSFSSALEANQFGSNTRRASGGISGQGTNQGLQEQPVTVEALQTRIAQIQEQLDVATIQKRVLTTINQSQDCNLGSAKMDTLQYTLMGVSDLYNDFACPLNLFDVCLLILETCRHKDGDSINKLWKSIICEEVLPCQTSSQAAVDFLTMLKQGSMLEEETISFGDGAGGDMQKFENGEWIPRLRNRVTALGKDLFGKGADYTFPLDLIVRELEGLRQIYNMARGDDHISQPWPSQAVLDVGVPFDMLLESYDSLQMNDTNVAVGGVDTATRLQRLASISEFLELWVGAALTSYGNSPIYRNVQGNSASSQLTRAINTGSLMQRIDLYKSAHGGLVGGSTAESVALVNERFAKVEETIRKEFF